ncbi:hypothetical protein B0T17DRAFT_492957 [Bombardia bombarda]|uniref:HD domain-containing protein n=1 Tax=Bombardia bombarda TaxID=252184 RepID=A0AA39X0M6_9PEZI|nr:hypothetical protein B0T17DRAFT_492957 [Bombardia bombarda]
MYATLHNVQIRSLIRHQHPEQRQRHHHLHLHLHLHLYHQPHQPPGSAGTIPAAVRALMPAHPACAEALSIARSSLPASILYHSFRVYLYAQAFIHEQATQERQNWPFIANTADDDIIPPPPRPPHNVVPPHILFVACILHDVGVAPPLGDASPERFEVVGADVAARILRAHGASDAEVRDVWLALALHTSPGVAERLGGTARAVRLAVRADFGSYPLPPAEGVPGGVELMNALKWKLPRLEIEKDLGDAVVRQAVVDGRKAPGASWPGDLLRGRMEAEEGWEGVNKEF